MAVLALLFALTAQSFSAAVVAQESRAFGVSAGEAILVDAKTGQILLAKDAHNPVPPASIVKVMTMLLAFEAVEDGRASWEDRIRVTLGAAGMGGSQVYLAQGEVFTLQEMMKAIAIQSANDASYAVAEHLAGSVPAFVDQMNRRAAQLGMEDTHFATPHGLPIEAVADADPGEELKGDHSTAYDIALMARELILKYPQVLEWTSTWIAPFREGETKLYNTNHLVRRYEGADGLKTGHTEAAGFSLVATAERESRRLISVMMGMDSDEERLEQIIRLLDYGFLNFEGVTVAAPGEQVGEVRVRDGSPEHVAATVAGRFRVYVPRGSDAEVQRVIEAREELQAPIQEGDVIGTLVASVGGKELLATPAVAAQDVARANFFVRIYRRVRDWVLSFF